MLIPERNMTGQKLDNLYPIFKFGTKISETRAPSTEALKVLNMK